MYSTIDKSTWRQQEKKKKKKNWKNIFVKLADPQIHDFYRFNIIQSEL